MPQTKEHTGVNQRKPSNAVDWDHMQQQFQLKLNEDQLTNCMRCGFCLPACPTYRETGEEAASPRGRIALMKGVYDGLIKPDEALVDQLDYCLGCRACETACPANVEYGELLEQSRDAIEDHYTHSPPVRFLRNLFFKQLFPHPRRMRLLGGLIKFYQKSGIQWLIRKSGLLKLFPAHMSGMEAILPASDHRGVRHYTGEFLPAAQPQSRGKVGLMRGCIMDMLFTDANRKTAELLAAARYDVVIPDTQTCCGALHGHSGEADQARELARQNIRAFKQAGVDYIVSNAGGCGAFLLEYDRLLQDDPEWQDDAKWFAERLKDVSEVVWPAIDDLPLGPLPLRITYQDSCHLRNGMNAGDAPRDLLKSIPQATFVELFEADRCCGSAGIYNLTQPGTSMNLLDEKMDYVRETKADILVTSNPGCLLQMKLGIHQAGLSEQMHAVHLVDVLIESLHTGKSQQTKQVS